MKTKVFSPPGLKSFDRAGSSTLVEFRPRMRSHIPLLKIPRQCSNIISLFNPHFVCLAFLQNSVQVRFRWQAHASRTHRCCVALRPLPFALGSPPRLHEPVEGNGVVVGAEQPQEGVEHRWLALTRALRSRAPPPCSEHTRKRWLWACGGVDNLTTVLKYRGGGESRGSAHAGLFNGGAHARELLILSWHGAHVKA